MHQQLLQFSAMPDVKTIRTYPVLGLSKDGLLPIPADLASTSPAEGRLKA
jgi:hypothetical protein